MPEKQKTIVPIVSSTHYDREWRFSLQQTRSQLVSLMDNLLEILESDPEFKSYQMDGQSVILEDYLSLRPEREDQVRRLISEGRLLAGPWYSLPDMNLVDGESIIRNLLTGHQFVSRFGPVMKAGYTATGFGHITQLPQIYQGFGIDSAMFYRGPDRSTLPKEFVWEAPDGSRVNAYIFTPEFCRLSLYHCITRRVLFNHAFYEREHQWDAGEGPFRLDDERTRWNLYFQSDVHEEFHLDKIAAETQRLIDTELRSSAIESFLVMDGSDSTEPQPLTPRMLKEMNKVCETHEFVHTDLPAFAKILRENAAKFEVHRGEMHSAASEGEQVNLFGDTLSARTDLKLLNADTERRLIRWAEPFAAFAWIQGGEYPQIMLDHTWQYLLNNHSHDCIAGCSQDIVHDDMIYYFRQARELADEVTRLSLFDLTSQMDGSELDDGDLLLVAWNPRETACTEVIETRVDLPADVKAEGLRIGDLDGREMAHETIRCERNRKILIHRPKDSPGTYTVDSWWIRFEAIDVPACGWKTFRVKPASVGQPPSAVDSTQSTIENDLLRLEATPEGLFNLTDKITGRAFKGLGLFEDRGDVGNAYFYEPPKNDQVLYAPQDNVKVDWSHGPLASSITVAFDFEMPATTNAEGRSDRTVSIPIRTTATLRRGAPGVEMRTEIDNQARDHRLRVLFPSGIAAETSLGDMPFDLLERSIARPDTSEWFERDYPNFPMRHFCAVATDNEGLAIATRGMPEYEIYDDEARTIALALVRGTRAYTPKVKAVDMTQTGPQQLGPQAFEYTLLPFGGRAQLADVRRAAMDFNLPLRVAQCGRQKGDLPLNHSMLTLSPPFELSAIKRAANGANLIIRIWNTSGTEATGRIELGFDASEAWLTNLAEERGEKLAIEKQRGLSIQARPRQIVTIELKP